MQFSAVSVSVCCMQWDRADVHMRVLLLLDTRCLSDVESSVLWLRSWCCAGVAAEAIGGSVGHHRCSFDVQHTSSCRCTPGLVWLCGSGVPAGRLQGWRRMPAVVRIDTRRFYAVEPRVQRM